MVLSYFPALRSTKSICIFLGLILPVSYLSGVTYQPHAGFGAGWHAGSNSFSLPYTQRSYISLAGRCIKLLDSLASVKKSSSPLAVILFHGDFDEKVCD